VVNGECAGQLYEDEGSPSGWGVMEVARTVLHTSVHDGGSAAMVAGGEGEVLEPKGKKRGETRSKKEGGGD
jgi:hypothetical protein